MIDPKVIRANVEAQVALLRETVTEERLHEMYARQMYAALGAQRELLAVLSVAIDEARVTHPAHKWRMLDAEQYERLRNFVKALRDMATPPW